jgi:DNA-binding response OmpR family regulator
MNILIVEDEPKVAAFLKQGLEEQGYEVDLVYDGAMGRKLAARNDYGLVLLDIVIPYVNGIELCRQIKKEKPSLPVLMLTALGTTEDKVSGFEAGADDYLVKPFEFKELLARMKALTRRAADSPEAFRKLTAADLELDLDRKVAVRNGRTIDLTAREFALLEYFMRNQGRVLSRTEIVQGVWDIAFDTGTNVVDVYVNILRKKIDKDSPHKLIHTRIGMGYVLKEP